MSENPLEIFETVDPELLELVNQTKDLALNDGVLPRKIKLLMAMALDASQGTVEGVRSLTELALKAGATRGEITEAVRVAQYICGAGCVYTAARAFRGLF